MDESLEKLIAAEKEGNAIIDGARSQAERIAREAKAAAKRIAGDAQDFIDGLGAREERGLQEMLTQARAASAVRISAACKAIEEKLAEAEDRAVDAIRKELTH